MEWSKDKTLNLIELLQLNVDLWNPSLCDSRTDKQKRKKELRTIADTLGISVSDTTKKIQHLRTQYNRESAREIRSSSENPAEEYISNWYAYEYLHFMKCSNKSYQFLQTNDHLNLMNTYQTHLNNSDKRCTPRPVRSEIIHTLKPELVSPKSDRDEFSVFGEYVANELRTLKGERNLLEAKKKIQDAIFDVKMSMIIEPSVDENTVQYSVRQANLSHQQYIVAKYTPLQT